MYAAPLNYDRFFRKVFSDVNISQKFLEDFLDISIEEITLIPTKHRITDAAAPVEFDFRCKIGGQYIIIDMQQWYKSDVVKRFYVYQALSSCLQLETLPKKERLTKLGKKYEIKNYDAIAPTVSLIWMVDDSLQFTSDSVAYALSPEQAIEFIKNDALWLNQDFEKINIERQNILTLLNNKTKELDFLPQNRLIFAFQKNIIKNPNFYKYRIWFEFAEATKNEHNVEQDFEKFKKDKTIMAVLERLKTDNFQEEDKSILAEWESDFIRLAEYWSDAEDMMQTIEVQKQVLQEQKNAIESEKNAIESEKNAIESEKNAIQKEKLYVQEQERTIQEKLTRTIILSFERGLDIDLISEIMQLPVEKVNEIIEKYKVEHKNKL